ncbi:MAG: histidine phosphatase family protein [Acidimicrobiales bacterium]
MSEEKVEYGQRPMEAPPGATQILLIRHGQSAAFVEGEPFPLVEGQGDPPLTAHGHWQAAQVGERLRHVDLAAVYVTTLQRTSQTAAPLIGHLGLDAMVEPGLREIHLGEWEGGIFRQKVANRDPVFLEVERTQDWAAIPGAESFAELQSRVIASIERMHRNHPNQTVAAVSHGGAIGAALSYATGSKPLAFASTDNGSIAHLVVLDDRWVIRRYNDTGHLGPLLSVKTEGLS